MHPENQEYILFKEGWVEEIHEYGILLHFKLKDGKISLFANNTDIGIGFLATYRVGSRICRRKLI